MSQPEMLPIVEVCDKSAELQKLLERERWQFWGRDLGLLTREQIQQANHPDWQWGDYEI